MKHDVRSKTITFSREKPSL